MKQRITKIVLLLGMLACCISCFPLSLNDNAVLYGTEWSDEKEEEGLKFFKDDSVLFFSPYGRVGGKFEYNSSTGEITLDNEMVLNFPSFTGVISGAVIDGEVLYMVWHKLGQSETFYATYYKRR